MLQRHSILDLMGLAEMGIAGLSTSLEEKNEPKNLKINTEKGY